MIGYKPLTFREKQLVSLRISYMGGYTGYFHDGVKRLLRMGFMREEMLAACIDETMKEWVNRACKP